MTWGEICGFGMSSLNEDGFASSAINLGALFCIPSGQERSELAVL